MATPPETFGKAARDAFLASLAMTANVTASAKAARTSSSRVYRERSKSAVFRQQWQEALTEGYARLEAELLAEALRPASGSIKDMTLKTRQMKIRLGMTLLSLHRASVRGASKDKAPIAAQTPAELKQRWTARLDALHDRMADDAFAAE